LAKAEKSISVAEAPPRFAARRFVGRAVAGLAEIVGIDRRRGLDGQRGIEQAD
jgi:hypothetical protein